MEQFYSQSGKALAVTVAWVFAQSSQLGGIVDKAFDQLFSLGLLVFVLIVLFREYKSGQKYNSTRDADFTELLKENIETRKDFQKAVESLADAVKQSKN